MATVDWESVVLDVVARLRTKNSHGQRELTDFITDSITAHRLPEGLPERALRVYGPELADVLSQKATSRSPERADADADLAPHSQRR